MELLRKIIEPLAEPKKGGDPDTRPIEQRRGDAFAEALDLLAAATTAPVRGGRPPQVAVTIPIEVLLKGTGAGTIDDTATIIRPRPCSCPCTDPKYGTPKAESAKGAVKNPGHTGEPTPHEARGQEQGQETEPGKQKRRTPDAGPLTDGIPPPRDPGQPPQPNTDTEPDLRTGMDPAVEPDAKSGQGREGDADPGAGTVADAEPDQGAVRLRDAIDPHDGCRTCGGGGSARYLGVDGKPISAATVRRLACEADLIPVVLGGDGRVLDYGYSGTILPRTPTPRTRHPRRQPLPLPRLPDPRATCITHHMTAWEHGGPTDLTNGVLLCRYHHVTVHHKGWLVRMGTHGHPEYVPPEWADHSSEPSGREVRHDRQPEAQRWFAAPRHRASTVPFRCGGPGHG